MTSYFASSIVNLLATLNVQSHKYLYYRYLCEIQSSTVTGTVTGDHPEIHSLKSKNLKKTPTILASGTAIALCISIVN